MNREKREVDGWGQSLQQVFWGPIQRSQAQNTEMGAGIESCLLSLELHGRKGE